MVSLVLLHHVFIQSTAIYILDCQLSVWFLVLPNVNPICLSKQSMGTIFDQYIQFDAYNWMFHITQKYTCTCTKLVSLSKEVSYKLLLGRRKKLLFKILSVNLKHKYIEIRSYAHICIHMKFADKTSPSWYLVDFEINKSGRTISQ